jgi:hypothetical protein
MTTEWTEVLDRFLALQSLDSKLRRMDQQLTRMPAEFAQRNKAVAEIDAKIKKLTDRTKVLRAQVMLRENELKGHEKKIQRLTEQVSELRTNKEYVASRSEIANVQGECDRLQNEVLKILDVVEQADAKVEELQVERQRELDRAEQVKTQMAERLENVRLDREALATTRPKALEGIPKEQLEIYERARKARGYAMAALEGAYCGGCGENQTKNDVYAVQNRTRPVLCRGCNRILYQP